MVAKELLTACDTRRLALAESSESDEETTSASSANRTRNLQPAASARLRQALRLYALSQDASEVASSLSYLEEVSVGPRVAEGYRQEARSFFAWCTQRRLRLVAADETDKALVAYMNSLFFAGHQAWRGQKLLASLAFLDGSLGRLGSKKIPRAWRALKGWLVKTPPRSRMPQPWPIWCGIMCDLVLRGFRGMALVVLFMVTCYLRPSEAMGLKHGDFIPPASGISRHWSLLLFRAKHGLTSKTGTTDDSISLDSPQVQPWIATVATVLRQGPECDCVWSFSYPAFVREFGRAVQRLGIEHPVVPYMGRHSGPSIDRALNTRDLQEIQKRGRWMVFRSVQRYEKHARLGEVMSSLRPDTLAWCRSAEAHLEDMLLRRLPVLGPPPRA